MQVRAPLMIEHRLIEKMLAIIKKEAVRIRKTKELNLVLIDNAVDFIRMYADQTHHGKEEDILFRDLAQTDMTGEERQMMNALIQEHVMGRQTVAGLVNAKQRHFSGDASAIEVVVEKFEFLIEFYPTHIAKEDKLFFPAMMRYFSAEKQEKMLQEFWEFDRNMIHRKYSALVQELGAPVEPVEV